MTTVSISQSASPDDLNPVDTVAFVRIHGDVDLAIEPALTEAVHQLGALAPSIVVVDLSGVAFACSTLVSFFARIHRAVPPRTHVMAHGAAGMVRRILDIAGTSEYVTLYESETPEMATSAGTGTSLPGEHAT